MRLTALIFLTLFCFQSAEGRPQNNEEKNSIKPTPDPNSEYKVYVPKDLEDCFAEMEKMLHPDLIKEMKNGSEDDMNDYHFGLGMWIRNNWGLWQGSRFSKYFNEMGIDHPDDMSGIILDAFWRHLNGKPLGLKDLIRSYQEYWKNEKEKAKEK